MQFDEERLESRPILAHADFGAPECDGCLMGIIRGEQASIECNECGAVVRTVPPADLQRTFDEMEIRLAMVWLPPKSRSVHLNGGRRINFGGWFQRSTTVDL